ncbi:hypothetical protein [Gordonia sp. HS-NH1]|uniref:hypothetical protein n=1 Tax=Gordonia sp. HS-NH1 TaxID=1435068 RepID=UPI0009FD48FD|nr:hypothetical protein [Gordonia sp. HS-NH1]
MKDGDPLGQNVGDIPPKTSDDAQQVVALTGLTEAQAVTLASRVGAPASDRQWARLENPRDRLLLGELDANVLRDVLDLLSAEEVTEVLGRYDAGLLCDWVQNALDGIR